MRRLRLIQPEQAEEAGEELAVHRKTVQAAALRPAGEMARALALRHRTMGPAAAPRPEAAQAKAAEEEGVRFSTRKTFLQAYCPRWDIYYWHSRTGIWNQ